MEEKKSSWVDDWKWWNPWLIKCNIKINNEQFAGAIASFHAGIRWPQKLQNPEPQTDLKKTAEPPSRGIWSHLHQSHIPEQEAEGRSQTVAWQSTRAHDLEKDSRFEQHKESFDWRRNKKDEKRVELEVWEHELPQRANSDRKNHRADWGHEEPSSTSV